MLTTNLSGILSFRATATAIAANVRVAVDSAGLVSVANETTLGIGVTMHDVAASGWVSVKPWNAPGTVMILSSTAVVPGARVYLDSQGRVGTSNPSSRARVGYALSDAAAGSLVEVSCAILPPPTGATPFVLSRGVDPEMSTDSGLFYEIATDGLYLYDAALDVHKVILAGGADDPTLGYEGAFVGATWNQIVTGALVKTWLWSGAAWI